MERKPTTIRHRSKALTDPDPQFVSLVRAGANNTPFKALRADQPEADTMSKPDTHEIARIVFKGEGFKDEASVTAWLEAGGYAGFDLAAVEGGFEVVSKTLKADGASEITMQDGVTVFVVPKAEPAEKAEAKPDEGTEAAAEPAAKEDGATVAPTLEAAFRAKQDAAGVKVEKAAGDTPSVGDLIRARLSYGCIPAFYDLSDAMRDVIGWAASAGDLEAIRKAATDFGELLATIVSVFGEKAEKTDVEAAPQPKVTDVPTDVVLPEGAAPLPADTPAPVPAEKAAEVGKPGSEPAAEPAEKNEPAAEAPPAPAQAEKTEAPAEPAAKADVPDPLAALAALVGDVAKSVASVAESVTALKAEIAEKTGELAQRVAGVEDVRQSRKGADVEEAPARSPAAKSENAAYMAEHRFRSALGIQSRT